MALITQIISIMFPIVAIVAVGAIMGRASALEMRTANHLNLDVFVPALVFSSLSDKTFSLAPHVSLAFAGLVIVLVAGLIAWIIAKTTTYEFRTIAPPMMFHNAGNVGLPIMKPCLWQAWLGYRLGFIFSWKSYALWFGRLHSERRPGY